MAKKGQGWTLLVLGALLAAPAGAQTVLTVDDAVRTAVQKNLSLQRTSWDLDAKRRQADNAWGVLIPSTSASAGLSKANNGTTFLGVTTVPVWNVSTSVGVALSLPASVFATLDTVKLNYRSGQLTYELAKKSLEKNVRLAYASLLLEKENLKLARENIQRKEKSLADTQTKYKVGLAPDLDVLSAQVSLETLRPNLQKLQASYENDLGLLKVLLGLPTDTPLELQGTLEASVETALDLGKVGGPSAVSPDVRQAELSVEAAQLALNGRQASSWLPTASLSWTAQPSLPLQSGGLWTDTTGMLSFQLSYSLDSFLPWTTSKEQLTDAEEALRSSRSVREETKTNSDLKRQNLVRLIEQAQTSLQTQALNVQLAQKTYDLSLVAYDKGTKDLLSLQNIEGDLNQARYDLLSQRYTLISAILDLEYELDVPFGTLLGGTK